MCNVYQWLGDVLKDISSSQLSVTSRGLHLLLVQFSHLCKTPSVQSISFGYFCPGEDNKYIDAEDKRLGRHKSLESEELILDRGSLHAP